MRARGCLALMTILLLLALAGSAHAVETKVAGSAPALSTSKPLAQDPNALIPPPRPYSTKPPGRRLSAAQVIRFAERSEDMRRTRRNHPGARIEIWMKGTDRWQVSLFAKVTKKDPRTELVQQQIWDRDGRILESYTGFQVAWTMARGYSGAFGRKVNSPWVWITLSVLFVVPFIDWRRPKRMLHLDLLVLSFFSVSLAFFNDAQIGTSVPLVYPPLVYLLLRMLLIGVRKARPPDPLKLLVPVSWLAIAVVFLLGFRVALNVTSSNVIDVGYAGVIGADRIGDGRGLYDSFPEDNAHGDTYGPANYLAYLPFEQVMPWSGRWDDLPAAHGAAIAFDLLACLLCFLIGWRIRGPGLGVVLAYCWAAFPFTFYALMTNANDALVAALVLAAIWAATSAPARGVFVAAAGLTKFAPLALAPLFSTHREPRRDGSPPRHWALTIPAFWMVFWLALLALFIPVLLDNDPGSFWRASIEFQAERGSPFSIWGLKVGDWGWLGTAQDLVKVGGVLLALGLAVIPRRRDAVGLAALSAVILIALQLGVTHWFYLYIPWFFPLVMIALLGRHAEPARA